MHAERCDEISRVARKAKGMRRVVFWGSKAFGATGPAHRGKVPDSSVVEQLPAKQSAGVRIILWKIGKSGPVVSVVGGNPEKMPNALVLRDNEATGKLPRLPGVSRKRFVEG